MSMHYIRVCVGVCVCVCVCVCMCVCMCVCVCVCVCVQLISIHMYSTNQRRKLSLDTKIFQHASRAQAIDNYSTFQKYTLKGKNKTVDLNDPSFVFALKGKNKTVNLNDPLFLFLH